MRQLRFILLFLCLSAGIAWADDKPQPAMQLEDNTFFDPSRKVEKESYQFGIEYRLEIGYIQPWQHSKGQTYPDLYLHGARIGGTVSFLLPLHFSMQTGLLYSIAYGKGEQHWRSPDAPSVQKEYITHRVLEHNFTIPVRVYYTVPLWKQLNLFFFTGPQLHIGLAENDYLKKHLSAKAETWLESQGVPTEPYDRMSSELYRANIQWGVGGGFEWDRYRIQAGYDFGFNNLVKSKTAPNQHMWEWGWFLSFSYRF